MPTKIKYRPEIDGIRAIAVISVVLFHAEFNLPGKGLFSGGYLGVDVFFVISGYLITLLILKGLNEGSFSFLDFYERRARRILPVLFTVMLASLPFAWFYLLPQEFIEYANSVVYSILFASNFWFWSEDPYWAIDSSLKPFLHTWSLAVEEQFYIVMPLLLIFLYRCARHALLPVLAALAIASLAYAHWASSEHPEFAFYMLPTRMWELLGGSLLAVLELRAGRGGRVWMRQVLPAVGVLLIFASVIFFSHKTQHPSLLTLIPIVGTMMVIWYSHPGGMITRVLSSKPLVGTGLISYGLYLWHYPIFAFGQMMIHKPDNLHKFLFISAALAISICTYFLIEKPFRDRKRMNIKTLVFSLSLAMSCSLVFVVSGIHSDGFNGRFEQLDQLFGKNEFDNEKLREQRRAAVRYEQFSASETKKVLILGDSHSRDLHMMFVLNKELFPDYEFAVTPGQISVTKKGRKCVFALEEKMPKLVQRSEYKQSEIILISESFAFEPKLLKQEIACLDALVDLLHEDGKRVVLTSKNIILGGARKVPNKLLQYTGDWDYFTGLFSARKQLRLADLYLLTDGKLTLEYFEKMAFGRIKKSQAATDGELEDYARKKGLTFLQKRDYLCDFETRRCELFSADGYKLRFDKGHHTVAGNKHFGQKIAQMGWFDID